jgi:hypothetical protein
MTPYDSPLLPNAGSVIDPSSAVGREDALARAWRDLGEGKNLAIADPRRMGKTVLLSLLKERAPQHVTPVSIDYEGVASTEMFLLRTFEAIRGQASLPVKALEQVKAVFTGWDAKLKLGPLEVNAGLRTRTPIDLLTELLTTIDEQLPADQLMLVLMDEVPISILNIARNEGPAAGSLLLQALRALRGRPQSRLRWVLCGSVGFHHVLRQCGATEGALNDLANLPLGPLPDAEARELAHRLLLGIQRSGDPAARDRLASKSGGIAFLIHSLANVLRNSGTSQASVDDIDQAFEDFIADRDESRAVTHLVTRLEDYYGEDTKTAEDLLTRLAQEGRLPVEEIDVPERILDDLIDDHYLIDHDRGIGWRYEVLRVIWLKRKRRR